MLDQFNQEELQTLFNSLCALISPAFQDDIKKYTVKLKNGDMSKEEYIKKINSLRTLNFLCHCD